MDGPQARTGVLGSEAGHERRMLAMNRLGWELLRAWNTICYGDLIFYVLGSSFCVSCVFASVESLLRHRHRRRHRRRRRRHLQA
jgi:hypothetical protein